MFSKLLKNFGRSLGWRLSAWYAFGFTTAFLCVGLFAVQVTKESDLRADREEIREEFEQNSGRCRKAGGAEAYVAQVKQEPRRLVTVLIRLSDAAGKTLLVVPPFSEAMEETKEVGERLQTVRQSGWQRLRHFGPGGKTWQVYAEALADGSWMQVARSDHHWQENWERLRGAVLPVLALVVITALGGAVFLTTRALRPIRALIDTTRQVIRSGDMTARVPGNQAVGSELDELNALFNQMLARNERLIRGMREALDNVTHDLRTPLTRMRASAEHALRDSTASAEKRGEALYAAVEESERTLAILRVLADISEAEHGVMRLHLEPLPLVELVGVAVDLYEHIGEEKNIVIELRVASEIRVLADRVRLQQIIANLLDNALKYSPPNSTIQIEAGRNDGPDFKVWLCVRDQGTGIEDHDLPRIWDRLYRGDRSRSERGSGLGLSLVKAVVEAHGGEVSVTSAPNAGSAFTILLNSGDTSK